jgi:EmrB/QacA subfamily drug resistance transporter
MSETRLPFAALILAMLPAVLDQTILATGLPTIARDLGTLTDVSWVVSAYVVAATATTPLWGKLGDRHGRKALLQIALAGFVTASALCGLAQDITQLIVLRAVQGVAAGGLMTLAMASVGDLVPPRERGRYQGYIAAAFAAATVLGPLVGGLLVEHVSWRWVFYVNLPLGGGALFALGAALPAAPVAPARARLDALGAALLAGATCAFMLFCLFSDVALAALALVLAVALVARERRAEDPVVALDMLAAPAVAIASVALFLATASLFAVTVFVPLYLQVATGATPTQAGLLLVPMMLGTTAATILSGRAIARTGRYKRFPLAGLALMTVALLGLAAVAGARSAALTGVCLAVFGAGFGMVTQVLVVAVQNSVERARLGTATAATSFFRALGGAAGAATLGAVFAAHSADVVDGVRIVFLCAAPLAALALLAVVRLPEVRLRTKIA